MTFLNIKRNDVIIIPSNNSDRLAFGQIEDDGIYEDSERIEDGVYFKKRKVKWLETKNIRELNAIFYQLKSNQHSISNINRFEPYINRVIKNLYFKDDNTHFVLKIEKNEDINFEDLNILMTNINILIKKINSEFNYNEDLDNFFIKISLQSKGNIEFIKGGKSLAVMALILSSTSCSSPDDQNGSKIDGFIKENSELILETSSKLDSLEANRTELSKIYTYGK